MKQKKKIVIAAFILVLLLSLTGCSQNVVFLYQLKMLKVQSMQQHTTMTFQLNGSGFETAEQKDFDKVADVLNNSKLDFNIKTNNNAESTKSQAQMDLNVVTQGMNTNMTCWVDQDYSNSTPELTETFKLPAIAAAALPSQYSGKEYIVYKPFDIPEVKDQIDYNAMSDFIKNAQSKQIAFLMKYAEQYDPNVNITYNGVQSVETPAGSKQADIYEIKLNDAQFKELIRYTVNNFVQSPDAMDYFKYLMVSSIELNQSENKETMLKEFETAFAEFNNNKPQFLADFNKVMDQLNNVTLLGSQGIQIKYAIADGYIINESQVINLELDMAQLNQLTQSLNGTKDPETKTAIPAGKVNLIINITTENYDINVPQVIQFPEVNDRNSIDYLELLKADNIQDNQPVTAKLWQNFQRGLSV